MRVWALLLALGSAAFFNVLASAAPTQGCAAAAARAGLEAIERTRPLGQTHVFGSPYAFTPSLQRVEVDVVGSQTLIYDVDVTLGPGCKVLGTSARLESGPFLGR